MSKKTRKFLDFDVRSVDGEPGNYWFTASTPARDRMGDIIVQEGWKTQDFLKTGGPILWGHDYYAPPIGRGKEIKVSPDSLDIKIEFVPAEIDPFAAQVEKLVAGGWIRTGSVGFQVYKREPLTANDLKQRPEMQYGERLYGDLLEFSIVPVPANPEALAQKGFAEAVARSYGMRAEEARSPMLPYKDTKGIVNAKLLRASVAAAMGARGGVKLPEHVDGMACVSHLYRIAHENNVDLPDLKSISSPGANLKEAFSDVWHGDLLKVLSNANSEAENDTVLRLVRGERRSELIAARDALNGILTLSEDDALPKPPPREPEQDLETASMVQGIIQDLSSVTARLKK
jgi:HK97 family phage prohead protease